MMEPTAKRRLVRRMAKMRPRESASGPDVSAPRRPPSVNILDTTAYWASFMGMQSGRAEEVMVVAASCGGEDVRSEFKEA